MITFAELKSSTIFALPGKGMIGLGCNTAGALIMVDFAPDPVIIRFLLITICSVYVPGRTFIVLPELAALTAACIVGNCVGRVSC
jgi:hypothetical protein